jgi:two-component system, response regulator PdtaR
MTESDTPDPQAALVVEDEVFIRMIAADTLADQGLTIFEAANADEALALLEAHPEIGILFTDVNMPGAIDGLELARRVAEKRPKVRIIVTSGRQHVSRSALPHSGTFLPKPYGPQGLVWAVESARENEVPPPPARA